MIKMMRMTKMMREGINKQTRYNDKMCEEKNKKTRCNNEDDKDDEEDDAGRDK